MRDKVQWRLQGAPPSMSSSTSASGGQGWHAECSQEASRIPEIVRFVQRLQLDWEAVENALLFESLQGQTEGQVHRLKVFKRQGYGRASPALLQARLVGASDLYRNGPRPA